MFILAILGDPSCSTFLWVGLFPSSLVGGALPFFFPSCFLNLSSTFFKVSQFVFIQGPFPFFPLNFSNPLSTTIFPYSLNPSLIAKHFLAKDLLFSPLLILSNRPPHLLLSHTSFSSLPTCPVLQNIVWTPLVDATLARSPIGLTTWWHWLTCSGSWSSI